MVRTRLKRGSHPPGTHWWYNNWDFNALGTIFQQQTKSNVFEAFGRDIAIPLQMQDVAARHVRFHFNEDKSMHPAYTFKMSTRDRARFGLLFLRQGKWQSRQIIPRRWVEESTTMHTRLKGDKGYGYMWWVRTPAAIEGRVYYAAGRLGQRIYVIPAMKLVIAVSIHKNASSEETQDASASKFVELIVAARKT